MSQIKVCCYDNDGVYKFTRYAKKIDICDSHTIIYLPCENPKYSEKDTIRLLYSIKSLNIVRGTVTVYFNNGGYLILTNA